MRDSTHQPIHVINSLTPEEEIALWTMDRYMPNTRFKPGDHFMLKNAIEKHLHYRRPIPSTWEVRFVISAWAYEIYSSWQVETTGSGHGFGIVPLVQSNITPESNYIIAELIEDEIVSNGILHPSDYTLPVVYAHGWPHGAFPDTAAWFFRHKDLVKLNLTDTSQPWDELLQEFKTPYLGYETDGHMNFSLDIAPDHYAGGVSKRAPLLHEEASFHTACLLGLEEYIMTPISADKLTRPLLDVHHDVFATPRTRG